MGERGPPKNLQAVIDSNASGITEDVRGSEYLRFVMKPENRRVLSETTQ